MLFGIRPMHFDFLMWHVVAGSHGILILNKLIQPEFKAFTGTAFDAMDRESYKSSSAVNEVILRKNRPIEKDLCTKCKPNGDKHFSNSASLLRDKEKKDD